MVKIERFSNQVFNKPVGVVRSQERTSESDTWETLSKISQGLSGEFFKRASEEAKKAGARASMQVDVFDENGQITKAPMGMGTIGTKAFEENMMRRYEYKMQSLIDTEISNALNNNKSDPDQYNTDASIAVAGLIDKSDPSMKGILADYASAKIAIGNNTAMVNKQRVEDELIVFNTDELTENLSNQAINAYMVGDNAVGDSLMKRISNEYIDLVTDNKITGSESQRRIKELRRRVMEKRIGIALQNLSSSEIGEVYDAFLGGRLQDLPDVVSDNSSLDFEKRGVSYSSIKNLIANNPHTLDLLSIGRAINSVKTIRKTNEIASQDQIIAQQFFNALDSGIIQDIGKKEMPIYENFIYSQSGVQFSSNPSPEDIMALASSDKFYQILSQQMKLPDSIKYKFEKLAGGTLEKEYLFPVLEMYQQMKSNMTNRGIPRDITSALGMSGDLATQLEGINNLVTFNGTQKGLEEAMAIANMPQNERVNGAINSINKELKPDNEITTFGGARNFMLQRLNKEIGDNLISTEVVDETLILANMVGARQAIQIMTDTVEQKFIESRYTVDVLSGGTPKRTRFAPEVIFGQGTLLDKFESQLIEISGMDNAVLGENLFVIVDPNSANSEVVYYVATGEQGDITPIIRNDQMVSIKLSEYEKDMKEEEIKQLRDNMDYAKMIKEKLDTEFDINQSNRYIFGMWGGI